MSLRRLRALLIKEMLEMKRDLSFYLLSLVLPVMLFLIYGYGLNMDLKPASAAMVMEDDSRSSLELFFKAQGSEYLVVFPYHELYSAQEALASHEVMAIVHAEEVGSGARYYLELNGANAQKALLVRNYLNALFADEASSQTADVPPITITSRLWFNEANASAWYLIPGQLIGVITLVCTVASSLLIAKEFNAGTIETLLVSRLRPLEIILAKLLPVYGLTLISGVILFVMTFTLFKVPLKGSFTLMILTFVIYMGVSNLIGLFISALVKDKFLATEYAIILSFMPSILLSGALYDLRAVPWFISILGNILPPTYAIESMRICTLSGGSTGILMENLMILTGFFILFLLLTLRTVSTLGRRPHA